MSMATELPHVYGDGPTLAARIENTRKSLARYHLPFSQTAAASKPLSGSGRAVPRTGFEPVTPGLGNRLGDSARDETASTCGNAKNRVAFYVALLERESPDLAAVVKGWNDLPPAVKAGIVAMVQAAKP